MDEKSGKKNRSGTSLFAEVEINHLCWFVDTTEHNKDAVLKTVQTLGIAGDDITNLVELRSNNIPGDLEFIKRHPLVRRMEVVLRTPAYAMIKVTSSYKGMSFSELHRHNVTVLDSPITKSGLDSEILLARNFKDLSRVLNRWKEDGWNVRLRSKRYLEEKDIPRLDMFKTSGFFELSSAKELLTARQLEIFEKACDMGYYDIPKKVTLEELAGYFGLSPPTLAEHLKKAEKKLLPVLSKVLAKL